MMSWAEINTWLESTKSGNIASWVGLLASVVGFWATLLNVRKSKAASIQARQAALEVKRDMLHINAVVSITQALSLMEEVKRLHRDSNLVLLPDRYFAIKKILIELKSEHVVFEDQQRAVVQGAILHFKSFEKHTEKLIQKNKEIEDAPRLNGIVTTISESFQELLGYVKSKPRS